VNASVTQGLAEFVDVPDLNTKCRSRAWVDPATMQLATISDTAGAMIAPSVATE
jgi:hypothetical protein